MTTIAGGSDLKHSDRWFATANALRTTGTDHFARGCQRCWHRALHRTELHRWNGIREGGPVKTEDDPFDPKPAREQGETLAAMQYLERRVIEAPLTGTVLLASAAGRTRPCLLGDVERAWSSGLLPRAQPAPRSAVAKCRRR